MLSDLLENMTSRSGWYCPSQRRTTTKNPRKRYTTKNPSKRERERYNKIEILSSTKRKRAGLHPSGKVNKSTPKKCGCIRAVCPVFNLPGHNDGRWCKKCPDKPSTAIDVKNRRCGCAKATQPSLNVQGQLTGRWCRTCPDKPHNTINVKAKKCSCAKKVIATFNIMGQTKGRWCQDCPDLPLDAVDIKTKRYYNDIRPVECVVVIDSVNTYLPAAIHHAPFDATVHCWPEVAFDTSIMDTLRPANKHGRPLDVHGNGTMDERSHRTMDEHIHSNDAFFNVSTSLYYEDKHRAHFNLLLFHLSTYISRKLYVDVLSIFAVDALHLLFMKLYRRCSQQRWSPNYMNIMYHVYRHYRRRIVNLEGTVCRIDPSTFQELMYMVTWAVTHGGPPTRLSGGVDVNMEPLLADLTFTETIWV